jgi:ech hydrogenase subunit C
MEIIDQIRAKSPWILHYNTGACNGCDIEVLACLTPRYDVERFGILNKGNPKQADIFVVTGPVTKKSKKVLMNLYNQLPEPKVVVAVGTCCVEKGIYDTCYAAVGPLDNFIKVDVYVPGCAVTPEAIIDGIVDGINIWKERKYGGKKNGE